MQPCTPARGAWSIVFVRSLTQGQHEIGPRHEGRGRRRGGKTKKGAMPKMRAGAKNPRPIKERKILFHHCTDLRSPTSPHPCMVHPPHTHSPRAVGQKYKERGDKGKKCTSEKTHTHTHSCAQVPAAAQRPPLSPLSLLTRPRPPGPTTTRRPAWSAGPSSPPERRVERGEREGAYVRGTGRDQGGRHPTPPPLFSSSPRPRPSPPAALPLHTRLTSRYLARYTLSGST